MLYIKFHQSRLTNILKNLTLSVRRKKIRTAGVPRYGSIERMLEHLKIRTSG